MHQSKQKLKRGWMLSAALVRNVRGKDLQPCFDAPGFFSSFLLKRLDGRGGLALATGPRNFFAWAVFKKDIRAVVMASQWYSWVELVGLVRREVLGMGPTGAMPPPPSP